MGNNRVFYAVHQVGIAPKDSTSFKPVHGVQSVGIQTTFNLEQVFELGQISLYENVENLPNVEVTLDRVLDGYPTAYELSTHSAASSTLVGKSNERCVIALSIFSDSQGAASGDALFQVTCSGMFVSSMNYTLPTDGSCKEQVTFVGNDKYWTSGVACSFDGAFTTGLDQPLAIAGSGGVQRREDVIMGTSFMPKQIPGISSSGTNDYSSSLGKFGAAIQSIAISTDLGRDALYELGVRGPFFRYANFPVEVTTAIEVLGNDRGELIPAISNVAGSSNGNLIYETIYITMRDGTVFDMGTKNKLQSTSYSGGDAGGGNVTITYNYSNFNDLTVTQPAEVWGQD